MKLTLLTVVSIYLVIQAQARTPCEEPAQWKAKGYDRDNKAKTKSRFELTYDSMNKRIRKVGIEQTGSYSDYVDVLELFNENVYYRYSYTRKTCEKKPLSVHWIGLGVPKNATFYGDFYIGASELADTSVLVSSWVDNVDFYGEKFEYLGLYTANNCVPVSIYLDNDKHDYQIQFFNVKATSLSDSDFSLPDECLSL